MPSFLTLPPTRSRHKLCYNIFILVIKGVKLVVRAYIEDVLQGVVKHLNTIFFRRLELVFQQDTLPAQKAKTTQKWPSISAENWLLGSVELKTLDERLWAVSEDVACREHPYSPAEPEEIPREGSERDPPGDGARVDGRVAGGSPGLCRGIGRPFWVALL